MTMVFLKDIANIFFFITVSGIGILSYLQARKTLFSPIKTEIFKLQIDAFQDVLGVFNKNTQGDFDQIFSMFEIVNMNAALMYKEYVDLFFKGKVSLNTEYFEELNKKSYGMIVKMPDDLEHFEFVEADTELKESTKEEKSIEEPALKLAKWNEYKPVGIHFTKQYHDETNKLINIAASPLLPSELKDLMNAFLEDLQYNMNIIREVLIDASKEMPSKFTTIEDTKKFSSYWVWNLYNRRRKDLTERSREILDYINHYLQVRNLMK